jgi:hypothetical protein
LAHHLCLFYQSCTVFSKILYHSFRCCNTLTPINLERTGQNLRWLRLEGDIQGKHKSLWMFFSEVYEQLVDEMSHWGDWRSNAGNYLVWNEY